jgi:hypothetical protein
MANIWSPPAGGVHDGYGVIAVGNAGTLPDHPWGVVNAWMYDGIIYGYNELGDSAPISYQSLGEIITISANHSLSAGDKTTVITDLNAGSNLDPWLTDHVITLAHDPSSGDFDFPHAETLFAYTPDNTPAQVIKGSMALWGMFRSILSDFDLGPDDLPINQAWQLADGGPELCIVLSSDDAVTRWDAWAGETMALWNEH